MSGVVLNLKKKCIIWLQLIGEGATKLN